MAVLAILAAGTWLLNWQREPSREVLPRGNDDRPLGYYVLDARWLGTDDAGRIAYRISADRLEEMPDQDLLRLTGVEVLFEPADETPWSISATAANAPKDASLLDFEGNVELKSSPTDGTEPVAISTERLRFLPDSSSAESDEAVRIRVGDFALSAVGLSTRLKGDTVRLESKVHGTFGH